MDKQEKGYIVTTLCIMIGIFLLAYILFSIDNIGKKEIKPPDKQEDLQVPKGYNFQSEQLTGDYRYYSDDDIRAMRADHPEYIIKVPGRIILSVEEEFEDRMEEYLINNPDILDDYLDENQD